MKYTLRYLAPFLVLAMLSVPAGCRDSSEPVDGPDRAVIVDQLHILEPDPAFVAGATAILEAGGFAVDLWQGENVTVEFYRSLPERGYKLILLRVHSGILLSMEGEEIRPLETTYLFTGETYTKTRYVSEQLTDKVSNAMMTDEYPLVFAVNSAFIEEAEGNFDNAVIIAMGCESYYYDDLAEVFIDKGASAYLGWNTVVSLEHVDEASIDLLEKLCTDNMTLAQAMDATMADMGRDPYFDSYLKFYPPESADRTLSELIR